MLDLNDLGDNFAPGLSSAKGRDLAEAAGVCLESQGHSTGVRLHIRGDARIDSQELRWPLITEQIRLTHADARDAAELGATGIAILLTAQETGYAVLRRAVINTGVDYWLGDAAGTDQARLEVSGILHGDGARINARLNEKMRQTERSAESGLPVYVVVVEFGAPAAHFREARR